MESNVISAMSFIIGIDASRNRSGGAKAHLIGVLSSLEPEKFGILQVHIWSFRSLLDSIPNRPWLVKHNPHALEKSLRAQLWWQAVHMVKELKTSNCNILFTTDASTLCRFKPMIVLSQDMLSYEPGVMSRFKWGYTRLRLLTILYVQNAAFRRAQGVIFLTKYAGNIIQKSCGRLRNVAIIPHGVGDIFLHLKNTQDVTGYKNKQINCLYVSPISRYKHQWTVVKAIELLKKRGFFLGLDLIGGDDGTATDILDTQVKLSDPDGKFICKIGPIEQSKLPKELVKSDIFIFASSCENMPVTLLEAMAAGMPIACSERGPMPEVLEDGGIYFDPENSESIANAIEQIINDKELRRRISLRAREIASQYTWKRCADETFGFIAEVHRLENEKKV